MLILCMLLQIINKVQVTHQGQGYIKVKVNISTFLPILKSSSAKQAGSLQSTEMHSVFFVMLFKVP